MLTKLVSRSLVAVVLLSSLISFFKFNYCRESDWQSPDNYVHACYTDIPALFSERGLDTKRFPYEAGVAAMEYPPVIGLGNWLISLITPASNATRIFFDINAVLIIFLFFISVLVVRVIKPEYRYLFPLAPAVAASLFINWDIWAVVSSLLAIYYFDRGRYDLSSRWLGVSIATKFFPIVLLLPIAIIFYKNFKLKEFSQYLISCFIFWAALNLPIMIIHFEGWSRFFKLNLDRSEDFGSIWYGFSLLNLKVSNLNLVYIFISLSLFILLTRYLIKLSFTPTLAQVAFFAIVIFTTFSKVYSPQYVLWLTPLAIIALQNSAQLITYWFWQAGEIIYHFAIWQYLALFTGAQFGLPAGAYAVLTLFRALTLLIFTYVLMRDLASKSPVKQL